MIDLGERSFSEATDGRYILSLPAVGVTLEVDRLRRERHELTGELTVRTDLLHARTLDGVLSVADFNLSSARARKERAQLLGERAKTSDVDWQGILEELCLRVRDAERTGAPALLLRDVPKPAPDESFTIEGLRLLKRHPAIIFGDGGASKSYLALFLAGQLALQGVRTALFDWELDAEDHRDRLERLFGPSMPSVLYVRCTRALIHEADRLQRIVHEQRISYGFFDSIAFACAGPPEAAEVASEYFRATRRLRIGSTHLAHVTKAGDNADQRPFGSAFWHNGARATWFIKRSDDGAADPNQMTVGLFNRKTNLGALQPPLGLRLTFDADRTLVTRADLADTPDLAAKLSLRSRIYPLVRLRPHTIAELGELLNANQDSIEKALKRSKTRDGRPVFVCITNTPDGMHRWGLAA